LRLDKDLLGTVAINERVSIVGSPKASGMETDWTGEDAIVRRQTNI
jgi:hypothetical protein